MSDFFTLALPFIFVFAVVYGALDVSKVLKNSRINALIALVIAFFAIGSAQVTGFILQIFPYATILFIIVFFFGFISSIFKGDGKRDLTLLVMVAALVIVFLINQGYDWIKNIIPGYAISPDNFMYLGGLILIIVIFYAVYQKGKGQPQAPAG
jgi:hypothetical protein